jgi:hypothetical protein
MLVAPAGPRTVHIKAPAAIACDSVQHPAAPDSSYKAHRGQGYLVQIRATYAEDEAAAGSGDLLGSSGTAMMAVWSRGRSSKRRG